MQDVLRLAHSAAVGTSIDQVVECLSAHLGHSTTATVAGLKNVQGVARIAAGTRKPHAETEVRLRAAYQAWHLLTTRFSNEQVRIWFATHSPDLGYLTPAMALGESQLREVLSSAEEFLRAH